MTGAEPIITAAISGVAVPIFQSMWGSGGKILGLFGRALDEKSKEMIFRASGQYARRYRERHGIVKVLGMQASVPIEEIYTSVRFLGDSELKRLDSIEDLEKTFRQEKKRTLSFARGEKKTGIKVANEEQYLMVLGGPGAGKSTFLKRVGLEALRGKSNNFDHRCIPVLIELKQFQSDAIDIRKTIVEEFRICGFPDHEKFTDAALSRGQLLILLDGLDEISTEYRNEAIRQIQNFVDSHDKNRFISSCRVAAYRHNFRRFRDVAMAAFGDEQIEAFIKNWFTSSPKTAQDCWQKLNRPENAAAKELTQTPLLLTLVCLLYQRAQKFPAKRATLYEKALRVMLEEWAGEKGIPQEDLYKGLDTRLKEILLSEIAYVAFSQDCLFLPRREISAQIKRFLGEALKEEKSINGVEVLKAIEVQHGVIVQRAEGVYSFSHLTLQEYLTAQYIDDNRQHKALVSQYLFDSRWNEVFLLVSGIMGGGADPLLRSMEQCVGQSFKSMPLKVSLLIQWAEVASDVSQQGGSSLVKRAAAITIARAIAGGKVAGKSKSSKNDMDREEEMASIEYPLSLREIGDLTYHNYLPSEEDVSEMLQDPELKTSLLRMLSQISTPETRDVYAARNIALTNADKLSSEVAFNIAISRATRSATEIFKGIESDAIGAIARAIDSSLAVKRIGVFADQVLAKSIAKLETLKSAVPGMDAATLDYVVFAQSIEKIWLDGFQLTADVLNLSSNEILALEKYLVAIQLILQCEKEAIRVSDETRKFLDDQLLRQVKPCPGSEL